MASESGYIKALVEKRMTSMIVESEYRISQSGQKQDMDDYASLIDMLELIRSQKGYEWMSDICIPELASIILTNMSEKANQYFQSRDFVDVRLDGENPLGVKKSKAAKLCLNNTLNNRQLYHYAKYMRANTINALKGNVYAVCWWEQQVVDVVTGYKTVPRIDEQPGLDGEPMAVIVNEEQPIMGERIIRDRFNYDVIDPRNVYTDSSYSYSIQQKDWVIIRSESDYYQLFSQRDRNGYINLDEVKEVCHKKGNTETATAKETYNENNPQVTVEDTPIKKIDVLDRYGKFWAVIKDRWEDGNPKEIEYGLDEQGMPLDKAELVESIITVVIVEGKNILIRFSATPYIDAKGEPLKPLIRGVCYIHPSKDTGLSDGKNLREIQIALNDTLNMAADRVKLATMPTLIGRKGAMDDNESLYFAPEHIIEVDDPNSDIRELMIKDDFNGAMNMAQLLTSKGQQVTATFPTTMGELGPASTTATAVAGATSQGNLRANYKSLTFEHTFNSELYQMILNMTWRFAKDETLMKLMGEHAQFFDPNEEYSYSPVSSNIETEFSKYKKSQLLDQMMGRLVNVPNPNTPKLLNKFITMQFELFGHTLPEFQGSLLDETAPPMPMANGQMPQGQPQMMEGQPMSNQTGTPQTGQEMMAREQGMSAMGGGM